MRHPRRYSPLLILATIVLLVPQLISAAAVPQTITPIQTVNTHSAVYSAPAVHSADLRAGLSARVKGGPRSAAGKPGGGGEEEEDADLPLERDEAFYSRRTAGTQP